MPPGDSEGAYKDRPLAVSRGVATPPPWPRPPWPRAPRVRRGVLRNRHVASGEPSERCRLGMPCSGLLTARYEPPPHVHQGLRVVARAGSGVSRRAPQTCHRAAAAPTVAAAAIELDAPVQDLQAKPRGRAHVLAAGERRPAAPSTLETREVEDPPTGHADEVIVGPDVGIEAQPRRLDPLPQQALGRQPPEVAVHRREAHPWEPPTDALEDDCRRRVGVGGANHVEDDPARHRRAQAARAERALRRKRGTRGTDTSRNHSRQLLANEPESRRRPRQCQRPTVGHLEMTTFWPFRHRTRRTRWPIWREVTGSSKNRPYSVVVSRPRAALSSASSSRLSARRRHSMITTPRAKAWAAGYPGRR